MATIHTMHELAEHIGANEPTEESMSHRIYKDTECGAWLAFYKGEARTQCRPATWDVEMVDSEQGIVCVRGRAVHDEWYSIPGNFPVELQSFLNLTLGDDANYYVCKDDPDLACVAEIPETDRVARIGDSNFWCIEVDVWTVTPPSGDVIGVQIGSIVEGANVDTEIHTLEFPFESEEFDHAKWLVEDEADAIWAEAHS